MREGGTRRPEEAVWTRRGRKRWSGRGGGGRAVRKVTGSGKVLKVVVDLVGGGAVGNVGDKASKNVASLRPSEA